MGVVGGVMVGFGGILMSPVGVGIELNGSTPFAGDAGEVTSGATEGDAVSPNDGVTGSTAGAAAES